MYSLRFRVLLWLSLLLVTFFGATIVALDLSLAASLSRARAEVLEAQLMALMATAEVDDDSREVSVPVPPDRRLASPESGLYGEVRGADGRALWRSPSALEFDLPPPPMDAPGARSQRTVREVGGPGVSQRSLTVDWEFDDGSSERLQFVVAQSLAPYRAQQRGFRLGLVSWFGGLTLATLAALALIMRRVLQPLGRIATEIGEIENGVRSELSARYPAELTGVARNLNALVARERGRQQRYRDSLANLAHSLKTPLAAIQSLLPQAGDDRQQLLAREIGRMDRLIGYQLKRASAVGGKRPGVRALDPGPLLKDLIESLEKVYIDKEIRFILNVDSRVRFYGDEGDFQEIAGNLLDNACKYGGGTVRCEVVADGDDATGLELRVDDDGAGLAADLADRAFARGTRLDETRPGQGIGLAVVADIVAAYGGTVRVERADGLGGASLVVHLPSPS